MFGVTGRRHRCWSPRETALICSTSKCRAIQTTRWWFYVAVVHDLESLSTQSESRRKVSQTSTQTRSKAKYAANDEEYFSSFHGHTRKHCACSSSTQFIFMLSTTNYSPSLSTRADRLYVCTLSSAPMIHCGQSRQDQLLTTSDVQYICTYDADIES